jgi:hypothetical protein
VLLNPSELYIDNRVKGTDVVQEQFKSLQGISLWELAIAHLASWDVKSSLDCWRKLREEAGWIKCVYSYGYAACLAQLENGGLLDDKEGKEAVQVMESVPGLTKRIAGKSIPLEVGPFSPFESTKR